MTEDKKQGTKRKAPAGGKGGKGGFKGKSKFPKKKKFVPPSTKKEKRALKRARNEAKPNWETVSKANEVWQIFEQKMDKTQRAEKLDDILENILGKMKDVCSKHDVSRAIQKMIKFGNNDQRKKIFEALQENLPQLSMDRHGHFIVIALLKCGVETIRKAVVETLVTKTTQLALHNSSAPVIDYMYAAGKPKERLRILSEFYGKEFSLFHSEYADRELKDIFKEQPGKRDVIMGNIERHVGKATTKGMFMFRPIHGLLATYMKNVSGKTKEQLVIQLSAQALALHHSAEGAWLVCECLAQGSPKVRKTILKSLKGRVYDLAVHPDAHMILVRALDVVDDVVLVKSIILNELKEAAEDLTMDPYGSKVLLFLAAPAVGGNFNKTEMNLLQPALKNGEVTSKKPPLVRRTDVLLKCLDWLLATCTEQMLDLVPHNQGSKVLYEVLRSAYHVSHPSFAEEETGLDSKALEGLAKLHPQATQALEKLASLFEDDENTALFEDAAGHYLLKRLLVQSKPSGEYFAGCLFTSIEAKLPDIAATNRGAFVVSALLENSSKDVNAKLKKILKKHKKKFAGDKAGFKVLLKLLQ